MNIEVKDELGRITYYTYDAQGNIVSTILPDKRTTTYGYNEENKVKFIKDTDFPGYILTYDKKVCIILFEKNGLGFVIENQSFSKMAKSLFELIWQKI